MPDTSNKADSAEKTDIEHLTTPNDRRFSQTLEDLKKATTLDTLHNDEAIKVLAAYAGDEVWNDAEEKRLVKKIDRRLLPLLVLTYGLQYYDKAMLSQAVRPHPLCNTTLVYERLTNFPCLGNLRPPHRPRPNGQ